MSAYPFIIALLLLTSCLSSAEETCNIDDDECNEQAKVLTEGDVNLPLGQGYKLSDTNILITLVPGKALYEGDELSKCVVDTSIQESRSELTSLDETRELYNHLAIQGHIGANFAKLFSLQASLESLLDIKDWSNVEVRSATIDYAEYVKFLVIDLGCLENVKFTKQFQEDLDALEETITDPHLQSSWYYYEKFINHYGSHIVNRVALGSRLQYFVTADIDKNYSEKQFQARVCAGFNETLDSIGLQGCDGISDDDRKNSTQLTMATRSYIRGGDPTIRNQLVTGGLDAATIKKFMDSTAQYPNPIDYAFVPLWHLFPDNKRQQAINLQDFYEGYLQTDCQYLAIGDTTLQQFHQIGQEHLVCSIASEGCHNDSDCHYSLSHFGCMCYGPSCVQYDDKGRPEIREKINGSLYDHVNQYCYMSFKTCQCKNPERNHIVWPTSNIDV